MHVYKKFRLLLSRHGRASLGLGLALLATPAWAQADSLPIIPRPMQAELQSGTFRLRPGAVIGYEGNLAAQAQYLAQLLERSTGYSLTVRQGLRRADICLTTADSAAHPAEGYSLVVDPRRVVVSGHDAAGVFYGLQSLLQLFPPQIYSATLQPHRAWEARCVRITDAPQRPWRGMMLDVARYFFDKDFVKRFIDQMAMYKLNKLQFHLIDDSGWRLEIKKYPRLTEVGAWAGSDTHRLGGYYTQDDIREIVAYAQVRGVEVVPEIEFPAHILSAVVAYPWLSCTGEQHEVPTQHFISRDLLCVGKETTYQFLRDVLDETISLFPSHYINIGGDEAVYTRWEQCPRCQEVMKREGLTKASELQGYLTNVVLGMMKEKGRSVIGWDEIIQRGRLNGQVTALSWHNVSDTLRATRTGHKAILTPCTHLYFDFPESSTPGEVKAATWMPPISLEKCYNMPINDYSPTSTVIGVQGCMWSDQFIHGTMLQEITPLDEDRSERYVEYFTFPRLLALSELAWTPAAQRSYADFTQRLYHQLPRLEARDVHYRIPEPLVVGQEKTADSLRLTLASPIEGADIRYTTDGSYPTIHSPRYTVPVSVKSRADLRAITVVGPRRFSLPLYTAPDYSAYAAYGTYTASWKPLGVQLKPTPWRFDCTGKISGNGTYEVTFVGTRGADRLKLGKLKVYKRDELVAEVEADTVANPTATYRFSIDSFEAGTPFTIEVVAGGSRGNDTAGLVFVRKG